MLAIQARGSGSNHHHDGGPAHVGNRQSRSKDARPNRSHIHEWGALWRRRHRTQDAAHHVVVVVLHDEEEGGDAPGGRKFRREREWQRDAAGRCEVKVVGVTVMPEARFPAVPKSNPA